MFGRDRNERSSGRPETRSNRSSQSRFTSDDRTYSMNDRNYDPVYNQRSDSGRDERDDTDYGRSEQFAESRGYRGYEDYPGSRQGRRDFGSFEQDRDQESYPQQQQRSARGGSYGGGYMGRPGLMGSSSGMGYRPYQDYGYSSSAMGRSWSGTDDGASQGYGASQGSYGSGRNEHWGDLGPRSRGFMGKGPKGYKRSDEKIHDEVCDLLTSHYDIDASEIEVEVKEGIVTLNGTVESRRTKRLAEDVVADMNGVKDVRNQIRVLAHDSSLLDGSGERSATYRSASNSTDSSLSSSSGARASKNASSSTSATRQ